jgi:hypothetical protein
MHSIEDHAVTNMTPNQDVYHLSPCLHSLTEFPVKLEVMILWPWDPLVTIDTAPPLACSTHR